MAGVPASVIPTPVPVPRKTKKSSFDIRTVQSDEIDEFTRQDRIDFKVISHRVVDEKYSFSSRTTAFKTDTSIVIQSTNFVYGVPTFVLRVHADMTLEAYHLGVRIFVPTLTKNRITKLQSWSALEETIRYLASCSASNKLSVIQQHIESMSSTVRTRIYSPNMIMSAFQYFATSRGLYKRLINDCQLPPSVSTLTRITSKVSKVEDVPFLKRVLDTTEKKQKYCVLLHDEVYVKKMRLYHGGTVFGKAQDHPSKLAETVLGIMIMRLHGGPSFISKIVPVSNLDTNYLHDQVVS